MIKLSPENSMALSLLLGNLARTALSVHGCTDLLRIRMAINATEQCLLGVKQEMAAIEKERLDTPPNNKRILPG